jgi:hypothetical protein
VYYPAAAPEWQSRVPVPLLLSTLNRWHDSSDWILISGLLTIADPVNWLQLEN